jgi:hypothetical protein
MKKRKLVAIIFVLVAILIIGTSALAQTGVNGSGWWSGIAVQHTDETVSSVTVSMTGYEKAGSSGQYDCGSRTLGIFGSGSDFYPFWSSQPAGNNCSNDPTFPTSFEGSAVLSADGNVRAVNTTSNIGEDYLGSPGDTPYGRAMGSYSGIVSPSTTIFYPYYKNNHSLEMSTFFIQNAGSTTTSITATFKPCSICLGAGNTYTYTANNVGPNQMVVIDPTLASVPSGQNSYGGVTVTSTAAPVAGVVFEHHINASPATYLKAARFFNASEADTTFYAPIVKYQWPAGSGASTPNAAKWSGLGVYNADTVQVTAVVTFTLTGRNGSTTHPDVGNQYVGQVTVQPGNTDGIYFYPGWGNSPAGTLPGDKYTAEVVATGDVAVIVNEEGDYAVAGNKDLATYGGFPASLVGQSVSVPVYKEQWKGKIQGVVAYNVSDTTANLTVKLYVKEADATLGASAGDTVWFTTSVPPYESADILMSCFMAGYFGFTDVTDGSDTENMADLCNGSNPTLGTSNAMIIESDQPIIILANEEVGWWVSESSVGDGYGADASSYEGMPLP